MQPKSSFLYPEQTLDIKSSGCHSLPIHKTIIYCCANHRTICSLWRKIQYIPRPLPDRPLSYKAKQFTFATTCIRKASGGGCIGPSPCHTTPPRWWCWRKMRKISSNRDGSCLAQYIYSIVREAGESVRFV